MVDLMLNLDIMEIDQPKGLMGRTQEHNENAGHETPKTTNKDKTVPAKRMKKNKRFRYAENAKGQLKIKNSFDCLTNKWLIGLSENQVGNI